MSVRDTLGLRKVTHREAGMVTMWYSDCIVSLLMLLSLLEHLQPTESFD